MFIVYSRFIYIDILIVDANVKALISWLLFVMSNCDFVTFPCGILGQVWYLIAMIPDFCLCLSYFVLKDKYCQQVEGVKQHI